MLRPRPALQTRYGRLEQREGGNDRAANRSDDHDVGDAEDREPDTGDGRGRHQQDNRRLDSENDQQRWLAEHTELPRVCRSGQEQGCRDSLRTEAHGIGNRQYCMAWQPVGDDSAVQHERHHRDAACRKDRAERRVGDVEHGEREAMGATAPPSDVAKRAPS